MEENKQKKFEQAYEKAFEKTGGEQAEKSSGGSKPVKVFVAGQVQAAVFKFKGEKDGRVFDNFSIGVQKHYKTENEQWVSSSFFKKEDLPDVVLVAGEAYKFLKLRERGEE